ncbi:hypothetical protein BCR33DRAFT_720101 [Rhizoclosmatium globosum]|uniref:Uncharacterized protein n=1 Tax=Rhizoclosmatium globosum TaxID=329046 RepID=A0A1Y2BYE7_9FUNG|nr:hypothetical protein BCR33DRAFT_720101 [Rhizoclosmatium globosum]|eukprot:ORY39667.1 hypothetical protein BCR33DRAFT_720101 [Rhizoclosmatium globosum]
MFLTEFSFSYKYSIITVQKLYKQSIEKHILLMPNVHSPLTWKAKDDACGYFILTSLLKIHELQLTQKPSISNVPISIPHVPFNPKN